MIYLKKIDIFIHKMQTQNIVKDCTASTPIVDVKIADIIDINRLSLVSANDDELRNELLKDLMNNIDVRIKTIEEAYSNSEWDKIIYCSHDLKGSCAQLGINKLSDVMKKINELSKYLNDNHDKSHDLRPLIERSHDLRPLIKRSHDLCSKLKIAVTKLCHT